MTNGNTKRSERTQAKSTRPARPVAAVRRAGRAMPRLVGCARSTRKRILPNRRSRSHEPHALLSHVVGRLAAGRKATPTAAPPRPLGCSATACSPSQQAAHVVELGSSGLLDPEPPDVEIAIGQEVFVSTLVSIAATMLRDTAGSTLGTSCGPADKRPCLGHACDMLVMAASCSRTSAEGRELRKRETAHGP